MKDLVVKHRFASAGSLEQIRLSIVKFYCGSTVTLAESAPAGKCPCWTVSTGKGICQNVRVRLVGRRHVFESTEPAA